MSALTATTLFQIDCDGRIATWPDSARDMFRRASADAIGQRLAAFIEERQRGACENVVSHVCRDMRSGAVHTMDLVATLADGSSFHAECSLWRCPTNPTRFDVLVRNITDRVLIEQDLRQQLRDIRRQSAEQIEQLKQTQARVVDITETIDEVFWMADSAITRMIYISPGYERVWGRSCASLYQEPRSFIEAILPEDRDRVAADLLCQRDGSPFDHEYRIVRPDGTIRWVWDRGFPVRNPDGSVDRYIGVAQDITARKHTEAMLRRQETLDAIGHMTGGLAHDFNNVLGVVVGHLDLIGLTIADNSIARESVNRALDAALRGSRLARRLLALARREPVERRVLALGDEVEGLLPLLQHAAGPESNLVLQANANPHVCVDPGELDAALINLVVNARAAMPDGGHVMVMLSKIDLATNASEHGLPAGQYAAIDVRDTGIGMTEDVLRHIGEPFFTTRSEREGTGLGVSMVHAFVRQSGGVLQVESAPGAGSCFRILLPVSSAPTGVDEHASGPRARPVSERAR